MSGLKSAQLLEQEHEVIHHVIAALPAIADRVEEAERADAPLTSAIRDFLEHYANGMHHAKEERFLFPLLERRGVPSGGCPLAALRHEHEAGRMLVSELTSVATSGTNSGQLIAVFGRIVKLYVEHMWKEDYLLIPMAGKLLSPDDDDELVRGFGSVDAAFGKAERERFEQFARGLQQQAIELRA